MKNDSIYQITHDEGRVIFDTVTNKWVSEFDYRDILGNLRVSFRDSLASPVNGVYAPPVVTQVNDYDAFGFEVTNNSNSSTNNYRFNKIESIKDFNLDIHFAFFRSADSQIGRWWQIDTKPNPSISLYAMMANNPVRYADPLGDTLRIDPNSTKQFKKDVNTAFSALSNAKMDKFIKSLQSSKKLYIVRETKGESGKSGSRFDPKNKTIHWNPRLGMITGTGNILSPTTILNHEFDHAARWDSDEIGIMKDGKSLVEGYGNLEEKRVITGSEVMTARALKEIGVKDVTRKDHFGTMLPVNGPLSTDIQGATVTPDKTNKKNED